MNDVLDVEIILQKHNYPKIYNIGTTLIIITFIFIYISFIYNYQTYYITKGTIIDGSLQLMIKIEDIQYFTNNDKIKINDIFYNYSIKKIDEELYVDESLNNYKYIYLNIDNLNSINNYVYEVKLEKENKKIIKYIQDYII